MKQVVGLLVVGLLAVAAVEPLPAGPPPRRPRIVPAPSPPGSGVVPKPGPSLNKVKSVDRFSKWKGRWNVQFANGVHQVHELLKDSATVKAHNWSSKGRVKFDGKSVTITYHDNRVERWTPVGKRMVVEHWFPASGIPKTAPVVGIGERGAKLRAATVYLSDLAPAVVNTLSDGTWGFGNRGLLGARIGGEFLEITVNGKTSPHSLGTHPRTREGGRVVYDIGARYERLSGSAAISDQNGLSHSAITFDIVADGKSLWRSKPIRESRHRLPFDIDVRGVHQLELVVHCPGSNHAAAAVWIEPVLQPGKALLQKGRSKNDSVLRR